MNPPLTPREELIVGALRKLETGEQLDAGECLALANLYSAIKASGVPQIVAKAQEAATGIKAKP
jgi:hypothetical protein